MTPVRAAALEAARGSTDFGEYFVYFSFFLVVAALLLAGLFFRLGLEQRLREVGLLEALGFSATRLRRQYLGEGLVLSALGGALGAAAAAGYAALVLWALRTLWTVDLGTRDLTLHLGMASPLLGAVGRGAGGGRRGGLDVCGTCGASRRATLLAGSPGALGRRRRRAGGPLLPWALVILAAGLVAASAAGAVSPTGGLLRRRGPAAGGGAAASPAASVGGRPRDAAAIGSVRALGLRGLSFRPGRSVLCIALVAAATFVIVSVGSFRKDGAERRRGPQGRERRLPARWPGPSCRCTTTRPPRTAGPPSVSRRPTWRGPLARFRARGAARTRAA